MLLAAALVGNAGLLFLGDFADRRAVSATPTSPRG